jgi:hypothetical protein
MAFSVAPILRRWTSCARGVAGAERTGTGAARRTSGSGGAGVGAGADGAVGGVKVAAGASGFSDSSQECHDENGGQRGQQVAPNRRISL